MPHRGYIKTDVVVFDEEIPLPEGAKVKVIPSESAEEDSSEREIPTLYERLKPINGIAEMLPPDAAHNVDHYLYGAPK